MMYLINVLFFLLDLDAASNKSDYEPEAIWRREKRKMESEMKGLKEDIALLRRKNAHLKSCIAKFMSDVSKAPSAYTNQIHPESQQSSDTELITSDTDEAYTSSPTESSIGSGCGSDVTIAAEENSSATLTADPQSMKYLSAQTNYTTWYSSVSSSNQGNAASAPILNPDRVKPFKALTSLPNSHRGSLRSLAGSSERSTTETDSTQQLTDHSNLGSMQSLSGSSEKSIAEADSIKPPNTQSGLSSSNLGPAMPLLHSSVTNISNGSNTKCVSTQGDPIPTSRSKLSLSVITDHTPPYTSTMTDFAVQMKKRRNLTDSGKVCGAIETMEKNLRTNKD